MNTPSGELMWVRLDQLEFETIIGIFPHERSTPQPLIITLEMGISSTHWLHAAARGALEQSVDYSVISRVVRELTRSSQFRLIESLVYVIAVTLLRSPEAHEARCEIERVCITARKPNALAASAGGEPSVQLTLDQAASASLPALAHTTLEDLSSLTRRLDHPAQLELLVDLPEVRVARLIYRGPGQLTLSDQESLISLGDPLSADADRRSWSRAATLLYVERRA